MKGQAATSNDLPVLQIDMPCAYHGGWKRLGHMRVLHELREEQRQQLTPSSLSITYFIGFKLSR
jgi:hypothetical protein